MSKLRLALAILIVAAAAAIATTTSASASANSGCATDQSGWTELSVDDAAARSWPGILDKSAFPGGQDEWGQFIDAAVDRNGDDQLCVKILWGENLNSNSH